MFVFGVIVHFISVVCSHGTQISLPSQFTNFELGVRVPLIVRAPHYKRSVGQVTGGLAELVDLYPTIAELAGVPVTTEAVDGVSLVPFFKYPEMRTFPTSWRQGTLNKVTRGFGTCVMFIVGAG